MKAYRKIQPDENMIIYQHVTYGEKKTPYHTKLNRCLLC